MEAQTYTVRVTSLAASARDLGNILDSHVADDDLIVSFEVADDGDMSKGTPATIYRWRALNEAGFPVYVGTVQDYDRDKVEAELERVTRYYAEGHPNVFAFEVDRFELEGTKRVEADRSQKALEEWYAEVGDPDEQARR